MRKTKANNSFVKALSNPNNRQGESLVSKLGNYLESIDVRKLKQLSLVPLPIPSLRGF
jgi:hypothetical protein